MRSSNLFTRHRNRLISAAMGLLVVVGSPLYGCSSRSDAAKPSGPPPVPVAVETVVQRDVPQVVRGIGTVQALQSVVIRPQIDGVVSEIAFREGQAVKAGDLLARIDDRAIVAEVAMVKAERASNTAQLETARVDLERYSNLLADEAIAKQQVDQQRAKVLQLEAALAGNDAAIAAAQVKLSYTRITSPISGRIGLRRVDRGNLVRAGDERGLVTVTQVDPVAVVFTLPQDMLPRVRQLLTAAEGAPVVAFDRGGGAPLTEGRLLTIDNQIDATTGTIAAKAEFPNADGKLWPGQFVAVEVRTGVLKGASVVSARAVKRGTEGPYVFKVQNGVAKVVPVKVAHEDAQAVAIAEGLAAGDAVVVDGHSRLRPDSPVKLAPAGGGGAK
jgi:RND family efflux transporter MFP subunit